MASDKRQKMLPAKVKAGLGDRPKAPVLVMGRNGLIHASTLERLKNGIKATPDPMALVEEEHGLWGGGRWTSDELRNVLVLMVSEGLSLRDCLESLRESAPPVPSYITVRRWLDTFPEFKKNYQTAQKIRGEMAAESATELALKAIDDGSDSKSVKNALDQLRWSASKLDRETFGEHKTLDVNQPLAGMSDTALDARIKSLLADPQVQGVLNAQGFQILDAEIVKTEEPT